MATVINNPSHAPAAPSSNEGVSAAAMIGIILAVLVVFAFIVYGLPALRNQSGTNGGTNVNVPERIELDVNRGG